jgi:hypothetical protein
VSPSGNGVKFIARGELPGAGHKKAGFGADGAGAVEMYDRKRFFTVTGNLLAGQPATVEDVSAAVLAIHDEVWPPEPKPKPGPKPEPKPAAAGDETDDEILRRAIASKNGAEVEALFKGETSRQNHDESSADLALCGHLAFWFRGDEAAIDRVFRRSGLMRPKWDQKRGATTYGARTIAKALAGRTESYEPRPRPGKNGRAATEGAGAPPTGADDRDPRPVITLTAELHDTVDRSAEALAGHGDVFSRVGALVQVVRHPGSKPDAKGLNRPAGAPIISEMGEATTRTMLSRVAQFRAWDTRAKDFSWKTPPRDVATAVLGLKVYPSARELAGVIEAPTIRPDGSLLWEPGYDPATGLLFLPNAEYPAVPERPSLTDARAAVEALLYVVRDFPFETDSDRDAWLAALLTAVARGGIDGPVPGFLISSNIAGTGKSWLTTLIGIIATGRPPAFDGYSDDDAEMEKRLTAVAIAGDRCVVFDNARNGTAIGCSSLDRAITARGAFRGRILGATRMSPDVPWATTVFISGNNLGTRDDGLRRFVTIFLHSEVEHPEERRDEAFIIYRETGLTLCRFVELNRPRLVSSALTLVRAYIAAGCPKADLTPVDFPEWSNLIRQAVHFATGVDPCGSRARLAADDETSAERQQLVTAWADLCYTLGRSDGLTTGEAATALARFRKDDQHPDLINVFATFARPGSPLPGSSELGYRLRNTAKPQRRPGDSK